MSEDVQITAQVVGCKTLKSAIAQMAILANRRVTALVSFEGIMDPEAPKKKTKGRKAGDKIEEEEQA